MSTDDDTPKSHKREMLRVRVTADELATYDRAAEAAGLTRSRWVRRTLHPERSTPRPGALKQIRATVAALVRLRFQLKQAGGNLNQLVRLVHEKKLHTTQGSEDLLAELADLHRDAVERLDELRAVLDRHAAEGSAPW